MDLFIISATHSMLSSDGIRSPTDFKTFDRIDSSPEFKGPVFEVLVCVSMLASNFPEREKNYFTPMFMDSFVYILVGWHTSGLYYKHVTIVNDDSSVISKRSFKLIDDPRVIIFDLQRFIIQATVLSASSSNPE